MFDQMRRWSEENLGQWHYVLGYVITLVDHNWPIMVALSLFLWQAARLYRLPTRANVSLLYVWLLLGGAYEYHKHLASDLHRVVNYLLRDELGFLNSIGHALVGWMMASLLIGGAVAFVLHAMWLSRATLKIELARALSFTDAYRRPRADEKSTQ
jgi:hypothetical protein